VSRSCAERERARISLMLANPAENSLIEEPQDEFVVSIAPEAGEKEPVSKTLRVEIESPFAVVTDAQVRSCSSLG